MPDIASIRLADDQVAEIRAYVAAEVDRVRAALEPTEELFAAAEAVHTVLHGLILADAPPGAVARAAWTALDTALINARNAAQPTAATEA
jgi:hypothetical protein